MASLGVQKQLNDEEVVIAAENMKEVRLKGFGIRIYCTLERFVVVFL